MKTRMFQFIAAVLAVAASAAAQQPAAEGATAPAAVERTFDDSAYRLSPGDVLDIKFMHNPELNEQVQVRPDGFISMPFVGELNVGSITVGELIAMLTKSYAATLRRPAFTIQIRTFANRRIYVGGEVARPGMLQLGSRETALDAVTEAGGLKVSANRDELIVLRRGDGDAPRVIHLSLKSKHGAAADASAFTLQPLDVVLVNESGVSKAGRAVDQYVRQLSPVLLTAGFSYLFGGGLLGVR